MELSSELKSVVPGSSSARAILTVISGVNECGSLLDGEGASWVAVSGGSASSGVRSSRERDGPASAERDGKDARFGTKLNGYDSFDGCGAKSAPSRVGARCPSRAAKAGISDAISPPIFKLALSIVADQIVVSE